jgi:hypothetical protein
MNPITVAGVDFLRQINKGGEVFLGSDFADIEAHGRSFSSECAHLSYNPGKKSTPAFGRKNPVDFLWTGCEKHLTFSGGNQYTDPSPMNIETITLLTVFVPIIGSFTIPLANLISPRARSAWAVLLGAATAKSSFWAWTSS